MHRGLSPGSTRQMGFKPFSPHLYTLRGSGFVRWKQELSTLGGEVLAILREEGGGVDPEASQKPLGLRNGNAEGCGSLERPHPAFAPCQALRSEPRDESNR